MLITTNDLADLPLQGKDRALGRLEALFFDDVTWTARYAAFRFGERSVLMPARRLGRIDRVLGVVTTTLTTDEARRLPAIDAHSEFERDIDHFFEGEAADDDSPEVLQRDEQRELFSSEHLIGATLRATDAAAGTVRDTLVEETSWRVRHLLIETPGLPSPRLVLALAETIVFVSTASN